MSNTSLMMILIVFILGAAALIYVQSQDEYTVKIYPVREGTAVTSKNPIQTHPMQTPLQSGQMSYNQPVEKE